METITRRLPRQGGVEKASAPCLGRIVEVSADNELVVDYPANPHGPLVAVAILDTLELGRQRQSLCGETVLLEFENQCSDRPIVLGLARSKLAPEREALPRNSAAERSVEIDGRRIVLEAKSELVLRCGESSITLRADGRIVIKGGEIVSRASRSNRVRGATVSIN